jgi:hypothetical protein
VEETNAAIEQTEAQANDLDRIVDVFTLEEAAVAPRAPPHGRLTGAATLTLEGPGAIARPFTFVRR